MKRIISIAACIIVVLAAWVGGMRCGKHQPPPVANRDTVRTVEHDTVRIEQPAPIASIALKPMLVRLPVHHFRDTVKMPITPITPIPPKDSAWVEVPIEQKIYVDSAYRAVVSGFMPSLDTIEVYPRRELITIREVIKPPDRRWSIVAGVGYGITPRGMQPYVGITVGYRIW